MVISNGTASKGEDFEEVFWGPYSISVTNSQPGIVHKPSKVVRAIPEEYADVCVFAYHIGLSSFIFLEIIKINEEYFLVYWGENATPDKIRKITPREIEYIPKTEQHLKTIFGLISGLVGFSTSLSSRAESDLTFLAEELDRLIEFHNKLLGNHRGFFIWIPIPVQQGQDLILILKERVFDAVEIMMVKRGMEQHLKDAIDPEAKG